MSKSPTKRVLLAASMASCAAALAAPFSLSAQDARTEAERAAHSRVAGCYAIDATDEAPWLRTVEPRIRLTLESVPPTPGIGAGDPTQLLVRPMAGDERAAPRRWTYLAWSLYGEGEIVSIVWSSAEEQIALTFMPEPMKPSAVSIASTTWFRHEGATTTEPVDVRVTAVLC